LKKVKRILLFIVFFFAIIISGIFWARQRYSDLIDFTDALLEYPNTDSVFFAHREITAEFEKELGTKPSYYFGNSLECFYKCKNLIGYSGNFIPQKYLKYYDEATGKKYIRIHYYCCESMANFIFIFTDENGSLKLDGISSDIF
jgi:hypothetical protein